MVKVYRFRVYDAAIDDYRYSTRMATQKRVDKIDGAERIEGTEAEIDAALLIDELEWTAKNFDPNKTH